MVETIGLLKAKGVKPSVIKFDTFSSNNQSGFINNPVAQS
jgi:hypothetical protein